MKTDLILLTGFLGSGKTTLMKQLLDHYADQKIGVIVNEFGSINIDAQLIEREGIRMAQLSNGSIFCACIKDNFVDSLIEMSKEGLSSLFIEASGLADPASMEGILKGIAHKTGDGYRYLGSICIIDAENFLPLAELLPAIRSQVEYAGAIILNKMDLADEEDLMETVETLREWNPAAVLEKTSYCQVDLDKITSALGQADRPETRETSNNWQNRANTFVVTGTEPVAHDELIRFLEAVIGDSYRIKGFALTDRGTVEISTVGSHLSVAPWDKPVSETQIVVISSVGFKMMSTITRALKEHADGLLHI